MKLLKTQTEEELSIKRIMYIKQYTLVLDKARCIGCEICQTVCPREAIEVLKPPKTPGEKLKQPSINIDENKCSFCGICNAICPFGALVLRINGDKEVPVLDKESFPQVIHEVKFDETKCPLDCRKCEEACPFNLIKISIKKTGRVHVSVDKEHCPGCQLCEVKCPYDAITVQRITLGTIAIHSEECPEDCHDCFDVCPVPGVLHVSGEGKVDVNAYCCVYCGICRIVCPVQAALKIQRTEIRHTPIHSGAWNKALEKLTSTKEMVKELRSKSTIKARNSVRKRFIDRSKGAS